MNQGSLAALPSGKHGRWSVKVHRSAPLAQKVYLLYLSQKRNRYLLFGKHVKRLFDMQWGAGVAGKVFREALARKKVFIPQEAAFCTYEQKIQSPFP